MSKAFEDCKTKTANGLQCLIDTKNQLKILRDRVSEGEEQLIAAQTYALLLQAIDKAEKAMELYIPKKASKR